MADLAGWIAMSHGPQLMLPPDRWDLLHTGRGAAPPVRPDLTNRTLETKWAEWTRCQDAIAVLRRKLAAWAPDVVVVVSHSKQASSENAVPVTLCSPAIRAASFQ